MKKFDANFKKPSQEKLNSLLKYYQNGQYFEAEKLSLSITKEFPKHPFAWKVFGAVLKQTGRKEESLVISRKSVQLEPEDVEVHNNLGAIQQELGRLEEAISSYKKAIELKPEFVIAHYNLSVILQGKGKLEEAEAFCKKAIALKPDYPKPYNNLGVILQKLGKLDEAEESYIKAIKLKPDYVEAHNNFGAMLNELGRLNDAERSCRKAITLRPKLVIAHYNLAIILQKLGRLEESEASFRKVIILKPDFTEIHNNLGVLLKKQGRFNEAEASYRKAIALKNDLTEAHNNLGVVLKEQGMLNEAEASYRKAITLKPNYAEAYNNLGIMLKELGRLEEAFASFNKAIELKVDFSDAYNNKNLCLNYSSLWSPSFIYKEHLKFEKQFGRLKAKKSFDAPLKKNFGEQLRIGYISPDFRKHSVAYFFEPLLKHHNNKVVETFCYYNNNVVDEMTKRLMSASDHWRSIFDVAESDVASLIRNDKIDILVDLSGHTGKNSLLVFVQKPAPIQVTWLGYTNTTGLSTIDYRFTDIIADPIGEADELHSETLLRLPNGFQCYQGNENVLVGLEPPQKSQGYITFGSFNNLSKITPQVIKTWSKILHSVPSSHLLLKSLQLNHNKDYYLELFKKEGLAENRIKLYGQLPSIDDHLELYNSIDICLDPFPFNGATTTCEALWMGVPVITLLGDRHVGRVGASILTNVGLKNFIAQDIDGYIKLSIEMASNTNYLRETRKTLRERMQRSPLCDGRSFANDVETAYQDMLNKNLK
ncbi:tetratricopeptide repeat protein [Candidatus Pelagibacter sp.]|nr:tetratricopeptide repeat protein [Candidatus Pelagibacter sp.]